MLGCVQICQPQTDIYSPEFLDQIFSSLQSAPALKNRLLVVQDTSITEADIKRLSVNDVLFQFMDSFLIKRKEWELADKY